MYPSIHEIQEVIFKESSDGSSLIAALEDIQERFRYIPPEALLLASERFKVPLSQAFAVATFYNAFSLIPKGKHCLSVCMGTACHVRGSPQLLNCLEINLGIHAGDTTHDRMFTLETVNCLGACALGPIVVSDGNYAGHMTQQKTESLLRRIQRSETKEAHG